MRLTNCAASAGQTASGIDEPLSGVHEKFVQPVNAFGGQNRRFVKNARSLFRCGPTLLRMTKPS